MRGRLLSSPVAIGDIADVEAFCSRILDTQLPSGMFLRDDEREDELAGMFEEVVRLHGRYDPARTVSFALYARFKLSRHYLPDICRRLLKRNGAGIAERQHAELDERADTGRRPWETRPQEQDDLRADLAADADRDQAERDRARARGRALLGL